MPEIMMDAFFSSIVDVFVSIWMLLCALMQCKNKAKQFVHHQHSIISFMFISIHSMERCVLSEISIDSNRKLFFPFLHFCSFQSSIYIQWIVHFERERICKRIEIHVLQLMNVSGRVYVLFFHHFQPSFQMRICIVKSNMSERQNQKKEKHDKRMKLQQIVGWNTKSVYQGRRGEETTRKINVQSVEPLSCWW